MLLVAECTDRARVTKRVKRLVRFVADKLKTTYTRGTHDRAWAIVSLRTARELSEGEPRNSIDVDWPPMGNPIVSDPASMIASLLLRRAQVAELNDPTILRLSMALAQDVARKRERSLEEWYLGSHALKDSESPEWQAWRKAMIKSVLKTQNRDGGWSEACEKSTVRATALALLCLDIATSF